MAFVVTNYHRLDYLGSYFFTYLPGAEEFMDEQLAMVVPSGSPFLSVINKE